MRSAIFLRTTLRILVLIWEASLYRLYYTITTLRGWTSSTQALSKIRYGQRYISRNMAVSNISERTMTTMFRLPTPRRLGWGTLAGIVPVGHFATSLHATFLSDNMHRDLNSSIH